MDFDEFIREWRRHSPSMTVKTSGSTGTPKEIELSREFVIASAQRTNRFFAIGQESHLHSCVGADFIGGKMMAVRALISNALFTWEEPSNRPLSHLSGNRYPEGITLLAIVPSQMIWILDHKHEIPQIHNIIIGGSAIHPDLRRRIAESDFRAYETYGMTETASHIALREIDNTTEWFSTLPGITVSTDERDCLVIHFHSPDMDNTEVKSSSTPTPYKVVTNDLAILDGEKRFRITGRYDHMIITGGKKVNPFDLENKIQNAIATDPEVASLLPGEFLITSAPDTKWGEKIVLMIATGEDLSLRDNHQIIECLKKHLLSHEVPKEILTVNQLPRTANGKLLRRLPASLE